MPDERDYDLAVYKVPRKDKSGKDITGDRVGAGGRHRDDGTYSGVAYDPQLLDPDAERRLSGPVRYEDLSPVEQIIVDGFGIAFTRLMDYASDRILMSFDNWLENRRIRKEEKRREKLRAEKSADNGRVRNPLTKAEQILQENASRETTAAVTTRAASVVMPDEFDTAYEQYTVNMTSEEAQKDLLDAFILYALAIKKLNKVAHAKITDTAGNITDGRAMIEKISAPEVIRTINGILEHNPGMLETWQSAALADILGRGVTDDDQFVPIDRIGLQQGLLNKADKAKEEIIEQ